MEYTDYDLGIRIHFKSQDIDLREIGIVSTALHGAFNEGFAQGLDIPALNGRSRYFYEHEDPLLVSLAVKNLEFGSLLAYATAKIHPTLTDPSIETSGNLVASIIWAIGASVNGFTIGYTANPPEINREIGVGDYIEQMVKNLSATGKSWELTIEDEKTKFKATIRSRD